MKVTKKQTTPSFPKNKRFLPPDTDTHVCVSWGKKCSFFGKFAVLFFLVTTVFKFVLLPEHRRFSFILFLAYIVFVIANSTWVVTGELAHSETEKLVGGEKSTLQGLKVSSILK